MDDMVTYDDLLARARRATTSEADARALADAMSRRLGRLNASAGKTCIDCGEFRPLEQFGSRVTNEDGLDATCRPCRATAQAAYRQRIRRV